MMSAKTDDDDKRMAFLVQVTRYESPLLFEVLSGVPKGKLRAGRLRMLAEKGLIVESMGLRLAAAGTPNGMEPVPGAGASMGGLGPASVKQAGGDAAAAAMGAAQLFFGSEDQ